MPAQAQKGLPWGLRGTPVSNDDAQEEVANGERRRSGNDEHGDADENIFKKVHFA